MFRAVVASAREIRIGGESTHPSAVNSCITVCGTGTPSVRVADRPATRTLRPAIAVTTHHRITSFFEKPVTESCRYRTSPTRGWSLAAFIGSNVIDPIGPSPHSALPDGNEAVTSSAAHKRFRRGLGATAARL